MKQFSDRRVKVRQWGDEIFADSATRPFWIVLTGAGVSAESGLKTFRDADGLWEGHNVYEVASPEGWDRNPELVREFYNQRRVQLGSVEPNEAHRLIAEMEKFADVLVVTQNVDDLHERAGSTHVLHLHGELTQVRSFDHAELIYDWGYSTLTAQDFCEKGSVLRPNIVWFGEAVPLYEVAVKYARVADGILVVGTSLQVYPAAGLIHDVSEEARRVLIDRKIPSAARLEDFECIEEPATMGMGKFMEGFRKIV